VALPGNHLVEAELRFQALKCLPRTITVPTDVIGK
jgi:hypothetical protein